MDFDTVIVSVIPYKYLDKYITEFKPEHLPYWKLLQLLKMHDELDKEEYDLAKNEEGGDSTLLWEIKAQRKCKIQ